MRWHPVAFAAVAAREPQTRIDPMEIGESDVVGLSLFSEPYPANA